MPAASVAIKLASIVLSASAAKSLPATSEDKGSALAEGLGENARFIQADVMNEEDIKQTIDYAVSEFGGLDILFNNAGGPTHGSIYR